MNEENALDDAFTTTVATAVPGSPLQPVGTATAPVVGGMGTMQMQPSIRSGYATAEEIMPSHHHSATPTVSITSAYVGNIHPSTSKDDVMTHFAACGPMKRVTIPQLANGTMRGCAYIEFESSEGLQRALQLHQTTLKGVQIEVFPKKDSAMGARGGRGGRGGFGMRPPYGGRGGGMYGGGMPAAPMMGGMNPMAGMGMYMQYPQYPHSAMPAYGGHPSPMAGGAPRGGYRGRGY
eukprot:PhF_6_TR22448/c0_g1_i1/m.31844/K14396/PABPN1, PABP2; polyadenylate-binding protein 2